MTARKCKSTPTPTDPKRRAKTGPEELKGEQKAADPRARRRAGGGNAGNRGWAGLELPRGPAPGPSPGLPQVPTALRRAASGIKPGGSAVSLAADQGILHLPYSFPNSTQPQLLRQERKYHCDANSTSHSPPSLETLNAF